MQTVQWSTKLTQVVRDLKKADSQVISKVLVTEMGLSSIKVNDHLTIERKATTPTEPWA